MKNDKSITPRRKRVKSSLKTSDTGCEHYAESEWPQRDFQIIMCPRGSADGLTSNGKAAPRWFKCITRQAKANKDNQPN